MKFLTISGKGRPNAFFLRFFGIARFADDDAKECSPADCAGVPTAERLRLSGGSLRRTQTMRMPLRASARRGCGPHDSASRIITIFYAVRRRRRTERASASCSPPQWGGGELRGSEEPQIFYMLFPPVDAAALLPKSLLPRVRLTHVNIAVLRTARAAASRSGGPLFAHRSFTRSPQAAARKQKTFLLRPTARVTVRQHPIT